MKKLSVAAGRLWGRCSGAVRALSRFHGKQEGATMVEYGLLVALIALLCAAAVAALGSHISAVFTNVKNGLSGRGL